MNVFRLPTYPFYFLYAISHDKHDRHVLIGVVYILGKSWGYYLMSLIGCVATENSRATTREKECGGHMTLFSMVLFELFIDTPEPGIGC